MFINCPNCAALVATDPATDLPPRYCPRCGFELRETIVPAADHAPGGAPTEPPATSAPAVPTPPPAPTATPTPTPDTTPAPPRPIAPETPATGTPTDAASAPPTGTDAPTRPLAKPAPSFVHRRLRAAGALRRRWPEAVAIAALTLLLGLQLLLADRARLAADPQWRPLLASGCGVLGCTLPPWREPGAIVLLRREVRPHPELAGVLQVNATIRNDARWAQAWPDLVLRLSDVDGRVLGQRRFSPDEYLGTAPASAEMSSGQRATIRMDVLEPSPHTVAFDFDFR